MMANYQLSMFAITFEIQMMFRKGVKYMRAFEERAKLDNTLKQYPSTPS